MDLHGRNLLKEIDLTAEEFGYLVDLAGILRAEKRRGRRENRLAGRNIALIFEKASTRTRSQLYARCGLAALEVTDEVFESPRLHRVRRGGEPDAHHQGRHGGHARLTDLRRLA